MDGLDVCIFLGVACVTWLISWALWLRIDGAIFGAGVAAITACIGYKAKAYMDRRHRAKR